MDKEIIHLSTDSKGYLTCQVPITKEQWLEMLHDTSIFGPVWTKVVLAFYFMPGHKASCAQCVERYGHNYNTFNRGISAIGQSIVKHFGSFSVVGEDGKERFWPIAIGRGKNETINGTQQFVWELREELVQAIADFLIEDAIDQYLAEFDSHWEDELYKWRAVQWFQDHWDIDADDFAAMLDEATSRTINLLASANSFPRGMITEMAEAAPEDVREMFTTLFDETLDLESRVDDFIKKAEDLRVEHNPGSWNMHYQSTNAVSTYLWLRYPDKYVFYKYSEYREVTRKLGLEFTFKKGQVRSMILGQKMYGHLNRLLKANEKAVETFKNHLAGRTDLYPDPELKTATIDLGFWISRFFTSREKSLHQNTTVLMTPFLQKSTALLKAKKNIILQGAPGTGKTYNAAELAVAIIDGDVPASHQEVLERYEQLRAEKRIGFTTFHQSMDYEDFIEGIKPAHNDGNITYEIEDGIFKRLCKAAQVASEVVASGTDILLEGINENPTIWKVSLEGTGDNPTRRDCMKNGYIRIGWVQYGDIDFSDDNPNVIEGKSILKAFQNTMKKGDIVVSCWSQYETDAIGIITGDYEYRPEGGDYPRYRDVKWIVKDIRHNIVDINNGSRMTLGTVYRLSTSLKDILEVIEKYSPSIPVVTKQAEKPYVLIIDEINRGNVSKIFGELITLLEKDKRLGADHPITLSLPYSKQNDFGVPQNLYIIGTMNTTDRSTGTIDYAIRRRFAFLTLPADREIIANDTAKALFDDVKRFIERYKYADMDIEDLMVGHSYFMADDEDELFMKIQYEVIPLVKEYIKDGILSVKLDEANKYFVAWRNLEAFDDNDRGTSQD